MTVAPVYKQGWTMDDIQKNTWTKGTSGAETLTGSTYSDNISGDAGDDTISGDAGDDAAHGGVGDDSISGGDGQDQLFGGAGEELDVFRIASGEWILIEPPSSGPSTSVHGMIYQIQSRGYRVIIAHPERCQTFQQDIALLQSLVAGGAMTQVTAGSLTGEFGRTAEKFSRRLLGLGLVHAMSADAHDTRLRSPGILKHLSQSGFEWLYGWLCQEIPEMIITGGAEPTRPSAPARGTGWRRILRGQS